MLRRLSLRDFVIVPSLELDWQSGFSALTGETGAGKSILLDALQLLLGGRGDAGVVREVGTSGDSLGPWLLFDFNHPLAGQPVRFEVHVIGVL